MFNHAHLEGHTKFYSENEEAVSKMIAHMLVKWPDIQITAQEASL